VNRETFIEFANSRIYESTNLLLELERTKTLRNLAILGAPLRY